MSNTATTETTTKTSTSARIARRFSAREVLARVENDWSGSDLELEIRADIPGKFLREARDGGCREQRTLTHWLKLEAFLDRLVA